MKTQEELEKELKIAQDEAIDKFNNIPQDLGYKEFQKYMDEAYEKVGELDRELRLIKMPTFSKLPTYGIIMDLEDFIEDCKVGNFIDYDGSGNYVRDGKKSNINIYPSDVKYNAIRKDFDSIIWFNR